MNLKKSLLLICQILGLFASILAANDKYPVLNSYKLMTPIKMQLYEQQKDFSNFFSPFLNSSENFEHLKKKMTLIDLVFSKLRTPKTWLDKCLRSPVSEDP